MEKNGNSELKRILDILKGEGMAIIIIFTILFIGIGYFYSYYYVVPKYQATETLLLIPNNTSENQTITSTDLTLNSELITTYSSIATQPKILKQVIQNLNLPMTEKELLDELKISVLTDTYIIQIVVSDVEPQRSMNIAKELSNVFLKEIKQIYNLENIGVVDEAELPDQPYNMNHIRDIVIFFAVGIFVSGIIIVGIYLLDDTVKNEDDIEEYTELKTLGKVPENLDKEEIITRNHAKSYITESINTIRTNILYMNSAKTAKTILITSCNAQEGKSFVSANIAASFAETNKKVLLIDADMRKGRTEKIFDVKSEDGLSNYLYSMTGDDKKDLELAKTYIKETFVNGLHILTKGTIPPNPSELLNSNDMKRLLNLLKNVYDVIIIDSPPCKVVTDSVILSTIADSVILVVSTQKAKIKEVVEAKKSIKMVNGNLIGVILNKVKVKGKTYSKNYYYGHAKPEDKCEVVEKDDCTVKDLVEEAMARIEIIGQEEVPESIQEEAEEMAIEEKKEAEISNVIHQEKTDSYKKMEQMMALQNQYLEKMTKAILETKIESSKNEMDNTDLIIQEINKEKVTQEQMQEMIRQMTLSKEDVEEIVNSNQSLSREDIEEIINSNQSLSREDIEEIINSNQSLSREDIEEIISSNQSLSRKDVEEIVSSQSLSREDVEEIVNSNRNLSKEDVEEIVRSQSLSKEDVKEIINSQNLNKEWVSGIIKQEILNKSYLEQFSQLENMIAELKENYLQISDKLDKEQQVAEPYNKETEKVINIDWFRKDKHLKKKVYSINEAIPYSDLEQTAVYTISLSNHNSSDGYGETVGR